MSINQLTKFTINPKINYNTFQSWFLILFMYTKSPTEFHKFISSFNTHKNNNKMMLTCQERPENSWLTNHISQTYLDFTLKKYISNSIKQGPKFIKSPISHPLA